MVSTARSAATHVEFFHKLFYGAADPGTTRVLILDALHRGSILEKLATKQALEKATQLNREIYGHQEN